MATVYDVPNDVLINAVSEKLKNELIAPEWYRYVKTGIHKEKAPIQSDWWYIRAASILRKLYINGCIGVSRLSAEYGSKIDRGSAPYHPVKAARKHIRVILQQLESKGYVIKNSNKGRILTPRGIKFLNSTAKEILQNIAKSNPEVEKYGRGIRTSKKAKTS